MNYRYTWQVDELNGKLFEFAALLPETFSSAKERVSWYQQKAFDRQEAADSGYLLEWALNEYWPEIEQRVNTMARGRTAKPTQAQQLNDALAFVSVGTGELQDYMKFVRLSGNMAISFNGQIAAGHPIAEELNLCPQLDKLSAALKRCGKTLVISETDAKQISVKGDKLRALVPCFDASELPPVVPDPPVAIVSDILKEAFKVCGAISSEAGETLYEASILLEANTCTSMGKSRASCLQYWHGIDLPPHIVLPKVFTDAVAKQTKALTGLGLSWRGDIVGSITFWFDGGSWIKAICYDDRWQDVNPILNVNSYPVDVPSDLFDAVEAAMQFNDTGHVYFADGKVMSHSSEATGGQYQVKGLQGGKTFNGKFIKQVASHIKSIDLTTYSDKAFFFGGAPEHPIRGAIMCIGLVSEPAPQQYQPDAPGAFNQVQVEGDDDMPDDEEINKGWGE